MASTYVARHTPYRAEPRSDESICHRCGITFRRGKTPQPLCRDCRPTKKEATLTITELHPVPAPQTAAVTVYTKPDCVQCDQTKKLLERHGIEYTAVDVTVDPSALRYIKETLGYLAAPVVVAWPENGADPVDWNGFRPDLIRRHLIAAAA